MNFKRNLTLSLILAGLAITAGLTLFNEQHSTSVFDTREENLSDVELLGKKIFEDTNLSEPKGVACVSCHTPKDAFQGNNRSSIAALAKGSREHHFGSRNTPSLTYAALTPTFYFAKETDEKGTVEYKATGGQFLDGRAADLITQAEGPMLHPNEMNNSSKKAVVAKVEASSYASLMKKVYGSNVFNDTDIAFLRVATALAAFENTAAFAPFSSKFDAVLKGKAQFTPQEAKGFALFKDPEKGNCLACHTGNEASKDPAEWLFTDHTYDNLGVPRNKAIPENADPNYYDLGLCKQTGIEKHLPKEVDVESLCGAFRVPSLRNVELTAPYTHNGFFTNLRDVVKFYATRDTNPEQWYPKNADGRLQKYDDLPAKYVANVNTAEAPYDRKRGETPRLNDEEIDAVVAFLKTLTDKHIK